MCCSNKIENLQISTSEIASVQRNWLSVGHLVHLTLLPLLLNVHKGCCIHATSGYSYPQLA
jgi:hypothetical protein